jgi:hypothetical protein
LSGTRNLECITTSIFHLKFKENNENDMAAHAIFIMAQAKLARQNGLTAAADSRLAGCNLKEKKQGCLFSFK